VQPPNPAGGAVVTLRPLRPDEYDAFMAASKAGYARGIEEHGGQTAEAAAAKADADMAAVLPHGPETPGHAIFVVEADGRPVGRLWLAERESGGRRTVFIYDITIEPQHQGRGYGRRAMRLAEDETRARGLARIELHVFGGNDVARGLYRSLGYVETSVQMGRDLGQET
jgi:ribosomal protein S18 acetylase RimI-like enzyme